MSLTEAPIWLLSTVVLPCETQAGRYLHEGLVMSEFNHQKLTWHHYFCRGLAWTLPSPLMQARNNSVLPEGVAERGFNMGSLKLEVVL